MHSFVVWREICTSPTELQGHLPRSPLQLFEALIEGEFCYSAFLLQRKQMPSHRCSHKSLITSRLWYAWQDSNLRPFAPEACGSKSLNSISLFLPYNSGLSGILLSLEVDPHSVQLDRVLVQFRYSRTSQHWFPCVWASSPVATL